MASPSVLAPRQGGPSNLSPVAAGGSRTSRFNMPVPKPAPQGTGAGALDTTGPATAFSWLLAWVLVILILVLLNRTRIGHTAIYYALVLAIFFLIVTQAQWFANALAPLGTPVSSVNDPAASGGGGSSGGF